MDANTILSVIKSNIDNELESHNVYINRCNRALNYFEGTTFWADVVVPEQWSKLSPNFAGLILDNYIAKTCPGLEVIANVQGDDKDMEKISKVEKFINTHFEMVEEMKWEIFKFLFDFYNTGRGCFAVYSDKEKFSVVAKESKDVILGVDNNGIVFSCHKEEMTASQIQTVNPKATGLQDRQIVSVYFDRNVLAILNENRSELLAYTENTSGDVPFLHAPYYPYKSKNYGRSLTLKYLNMNKDFAYRLSDLSTNAGASTFDEVVLKSDTVKKEDLERGAWTVNQIGKDDALQVMQKNQVNPDIESVLKHIKSYIFTDAGLNSVVIGDGNTNTSVLSGKALGFFFMNIKEKVDVAKVTLTPMFKKLFMRIAKWGAQHKGLILPENMTITVKYNELIKDDTSIKVADNVALVEAGLRSKKSAMKDIGTIDPDGELALISNEQSNEPPKSPSKTKVGK